MSKVLDDPFKPITIKVPCMREECKNMVKVSVPRGYKRKMRKFCHHCLQTANRTDSYFNDNYSDGNKRK